MERIPQLGNGIICIDSQEFEIKENRGKLGHSLPIKDVAHDVLDPSERFWAWQAVITKSSNSSRCNIAKVGAYDQEATQSYVQSFPSPAVFDGNVSSFISMVLN